MGIKRTTREQWLKSYEEPAARIAAVRQELLWLLGASSYGAELPHSTLVSALSRANTQLAELQSNWARWCEYPYRRGAPKCPHCTARIVALDARYCPRCGRRLDAPADAQLGLEAA